MPGIHATPSTTVLVTGANGYIGYWIVRKLLEQGYAVRAAVRSLEKGRPLKEYFASHGDKLELVVVPDITKAGAFDEAVKGVDGIIHTATSSDFSVVEPEGLIKPAVDGTLSVLESAKNFGTQVKRIVVTSSIVAAGYKPSPPTQHLSEQDWNDFAVELAKSQGKDASPFIKYTAAKVLAERAAWDFYHKHQSTLPWELVTILPAHVLGPALQPVKGPETLNVSLLLFWDQLANAKSEDEVKGTYHYIHVEDIAQAHVAALERAEAGGERIFVSAGANTWQGARNIAHALRPDLYAKNIFQRGNPDLDSTLSFVFDIEKGKKVLGLEYEKSKEEQVIKDTLDFFESKGYFESLSKA